MYNNIICKIYQHVERKPATEEYCGEGKPTPIAMKYAARANGNNNSVIN